MVKSVENLQSNGSFGVEESLKIMLWSLNLNLIVTRKKKCCQVINVSNNESHLIKNSSCSVIISKC